MALFSRNFESKHEETSISRRSLFNILPAVGLMTLASPSFASDVDPFAAMDDMLSSGTAGPGMSKTNSNSDKSNTKPSSDSNKTPSTQNPDMAAALKESKKRRTIDPRTHG